MKHFRISITIIIIIFIFNSVITAQSKPYSVNLKPYFGLNSGKTDYTMDLKYPDGGFTYFFKSQLEFPLDQTMFGCEIEYIISPGTPQEWAFTVGFYTQANDPSGIMYDHDWTNYRSRIYEKISYTESNAKGKNNILLVEFDKTVLIGKKGSLSISGGYKYQKIEQDIYGLKGWQIDLDGIKYEFEIPDTNGLYYEITYKLPNVGFRFNYFLNQKLNFNSRIAYTRAIISDFDDHLLRFKTTESSINGNGLLADFGLHMDFGPTPSKGFFLEFNGDFTYIKASGTSTQSWYGDDPAGEEDETGQSVSSIPHEISTTQFRLGVVLGLGI